MQKFATQRQRHTEAMDEYAQLTARAADMEGGVIHGRCTSDSVAAVLQTIHERMHVLKNAAVEYARAREV